MDKLPDVYEELDIGELAITHVFRDYEHERVGFIVQGDHKIAPLYVYVSDEQATELSESFHHWLGEGNGSQAFEPGSEAIDSAYPPGTAEVAAGGS